MTFPQYYLLKMNKGAFRIFGMRYANLPAFLLSLSLTSYVSCLIKEGCTSAQTGFQGAHGQKHQLQSVMIIARTVN